MDPCFSLCSPNPFYCPCPYEKQEKKQGENFSAQLNAYLHLLLQ